MNDGTRSITGITAMLDLILCAIALALVQIFAMPALNLHQMKYLLSNRDTEIELSPMAERVQRAAKNLQESLPIFLTLALLSIHYQVDNSDPAIGWLLCRLAHFLCYTLSITMLRSVAFVGSLIALGAMAFALL
jgi:uncharacterized MAPEG superfamily protein